MEEIKNTLIQLGTIVNTKGIAGEMAIINTPKGIFLPAGSPVFIGYSKNFIEKYFLLDDFIGQVSRSNLALKGIESKESALLFKEKGMFAYKEEILKYNENYIFRDEILGCNVFDIEKKCNIGEIVDIWEMPANNVWIVKTSNGDLPLPVIDEVIQDCDFENKIIKIKMLDGLEEIMIK